MTFFLSYYLFHISRENNNNKPGFMNQEDAKVSDKFDLFLPPLLSLPD